MGFRYSEIHIDFLRCGFKEMRIPELTMAFNKKFKADKSAGEIRSALKNRKITCGRRGGWEKGSSNLFTAVQVKFIRDNYADLSCAEVAGALKEKFGMKVAASQIKAFVQNHGIKSGRTGCFKKGNKPWNTGTKGTGICKPNSGCFVKGSTPATVKHIGSERICAKDGYVFVKIAEENSYTGHATRYKAKHIIVWESHNGPVPAGKVILFLDGNPQNCDDIDNLKLISRAEHLRLNQFGYRNTPDEFRPSVLAIAQLETKVFKLARAEK